MSKKIILFLTFTFLAGFSIAQTFTLTSNDLSGQFTKKHVLTYCGGENVSPQLSWANAPEGTKSFAITIHDPDAPTGSGWWHWVVFNIPADVSQLEAGAGSTDKSLLPEGAIQSLTDFGDKGYGGPCPPAGHGFHQYLITVYALSVDSLKLDSDANPATVGFYLYSTTLEKASIVGYYKSEK